LKYHAEFLRTETDELAKNLSRGVLVSHRHVFDNRVVNYL